MFYGQRARSGAINYDQPEMLNALHWPASQAISDLVDDIVT